MIIYSRTRLWGLLVLLGCVCWSSWVDADSTELQEWKGLITLHPDANVLKAARDARNHAALNFAVQRIEHARGPTVNFDEFAVTITQLPQTGPTSKEALFQYVRINLKEFLDSEFAIFAEGLRTEDTQDWRAQTQAPLGAIMLFRIPPFESGTPASYVLQEQAAVVVSHVSETGWIFSPITVGMAAPGEHPVSGNREFGVRQAPNGEFQIYTRGVDRAIDRKFPKESTVFRGADALWMSFQRNLVKFVEKYGGRAQIERPIVRRPAWFSTEVAALLGKDLQTLRVQEKIQEVAQQRQAQRQRLAAEERKKWGHILKQRGWDYLVSAINLACVNSQSFQQKFKDQKLPGVLFKEDEFNKFYDKEKTKKGGVLGFLKPQSEQALTACQIYVLDKMKLTNNSVSVSWVVAEISAFKTPKPKIVDTEPNQVAKVVDEYYSDIKVFVPRESYSSETQGSDRPPRGINMKFGNFDFSKPDFDMGPGSTLGR